MADPTSRSPAALSAGEWLHQQSRSLPFIVSENTLRWAIRGNDTAALPVDIPEHLVLSARVDDRGSAELRLDGHSLPQMHVEQGRMHLVGPGSIHRLVVERATDLTVVDVHIESLDLTETSQRTALSSPDRPAAIDKLLLGDTELAVAGAGIQASEVVIPPHGRIHLSGGAVSATSVVGSDALELTGTLRTAALTATTVRLPEGAHLQITGRVQEPLLLLLEGGSLEVEGADALIESLVVRGSRGMVRVSGGSLSRPQFDTDAPCTLDVYEGGEVLLAEGEVSLTIAHGVIIGNPDRGIRLRTLSLPDASAEIENLNFFDADVTLLTELEQVRRVTPWWPARDAARERSEEWSGGLRAADVRAVARAHYWGQVEHLLAQKGARGNDVVVAHEIAQNARRLAARNRSAERILLEASRFFGYTARPVRPIFRWVIASLAFAVLTRAVSWDLCWCNPSSGVDLWVDVVISPVTWVRQVGDESELSSLVESSSAAELMAFGARLFGTVALAATALAIRRYVQPARSERPG